MMIPIIVVCYVFTYVNSAEKMQREGRLYEIVVVLDWNITE
ncbi:hypothetical protein [Bartonella acomydis]